MTRKRFDLVERIVRIRLLSMGFYSLREFAQHLKESDESKGEGRKPYHKDYWWRTLSRSSPMSRLELAAKKLDITLEDICGLTLSEGNNTITKELRRPLYE